MACRVVLHIREQGEMDRKGSVLSEQITGPLQFAAPSQRTANPVITDISEDSTVNQSGPTGAGTSTGTWR